MVKVTKQIPHACPVCKGRGEIAKDIAQHEAQPKYDGSEIYACHVCSGSCLIWEIREEEKEPDLTGMQLPPSILQPSIGIPTIQQPIQQTYPPYGVTWTSNVPPGFDMSKIQTSNGFVFGGLNDGKCACGPAGQPHHDNCKAG